MDIEKLICCFESKRAAKDEKHQEYLESLEIKNKATRERCLRVSDKYNVEMTWSNGYVYKFKTLSKEITLCDQTERTVGNYNKILINKREIDFFHTYEHEISEDQDLKEAFGYKDIYINLPIDAALNELLKKITKEEIS